MLTFTPLDLDWSGQAVYIIGGGPSLQDFDFGILEGKGIILGVNKAPFHVKFCDYLFSLDQTFVRNCRNDIAKFIDDGGKAILGMPPNENGHKAIPGAQYVYRRRNQGLSDNPEDVYGLNSGYGGLGIAYQANPSSIALLGFDMDYDANGKTHWHEGYEWHSHQNHRFMERWATNFDRARQQLDAKGIDVVNFVGPRGSRITAFPTSSLADL